MNKDCAARENNKDLLGLFVSCVGADYKTDYSPHLWPEFSEDTVLLWNEIESRMNERKTLNFDREGCCNEILAEIQIQKDLCDSGEGSTTSYHYGIQSGLNLALRIISKAITDNDSQ
jgi:hypothetical protein